MTTDPHRYADAAIDAIWKCMRERRDMRHFLHEALPDPVRLCRRCGRRRLSPEQYPGCDAGPSRRMLRTFRRGLPVTETDSRRLDGALDASMR